MLREIALVVIVALVALWFALLPGDGVTVNCSLAEFHPDLVKYRDACRGAR